MGVSLIIKCFDSSCQGRQGDAIVTIPMYSVVHTLVTRIGALVLEWALLAVQGFISYK